MEGPRRHRCRLRHLRRPPIGLLLICLALLRRRRVILLIRQDTPRYFSSRLPGRAWAPLLIPIRVVDWIFRMLARWLPTTVVGPEIARAYGAPRENVLEMRVNLLSKDQLAAKPASAEWSERVRLLTVGRIESEKNPRLVIEALAQLEQSHPGRYSLTWVGTGHLEAELRAHASRLGIEGSLHLPGFVPFWAEAPRALPIRRRVPACLGDGGTSAGSL